MKFTQYFLHIRQRPDRAKIKMEWIEETIKDPAYTEVQSMEEFGSGQRLRQKVSFSGSSCFGMEKRYIMPFSTGVLKEE